MKKCPGTGMPSIPRDEKHDHNAMCPHCGKHVKGKPGHKTPPHKYF